MVAETETNAPTIIAVQRNPIEPSERGSRLDGWSCAGTQGEERMRVRRRREGFGGEREGAEADAASMTALQAEPPRPGLHFLLSTFYFSPPFLILGPQWLTSGIVWYGYPSYAFSLAFASSFCTIASAFHAACFRPRTLPCILLHQG